MSNNEYEQQQFWKDKAKLILNKETLRHFKNNDLLLFGEVCFKVTKNGIERIHPLKVITNLKKAAKYEQ